MSEKSDSRRRRRSGLAALGLLLVACGIVDRRVEERAAAGASAGGNVGFGAANSMTAGAPSFAGQYMGGTPPIIGVAGAVGGMAVAGFGSGGKAINFIVDDLEDGDDFTLPFLNGRGAVVHGQRRQRAAVSEPLCAGVTFAAHAASAQRRQLRDAYLR